MKIHEYNDMMAYLMRPATGDRSNFAIGGGQFQGQDMGTREGFSTLNEIKKIKEYKNVPGKFYVKNLPVVRDTPIEELEKIPGYVRKTGDGIIFDNKTNATKFTKSKLVKNILANRSIINQPDFQKQVSDLIDEGLETAKIAERLNSSPTTVSMTRKIIGKKGQGGKPRQNLFGVLNEDGQFENFFKEYLEKESKIEVAGRTRESKIWPIIKKALKNVSEDASLEEKFAAIRNFDEPASKYGYKPKFLKGKKYDFKIGDYLYSQISNSFKDAKKGFGKITMKQLADAVPAYTYDTLLNLFGNSKKDPDLIKGDDKISRNKRSNINNAKDIIKKLKTAGLVISQGDTDTAGSGKSYLFEELTDEVKAKLKDIKPFKESAKDFDQVELRRLVSMFSKASEDYNKFGFAKMGSTLDDAASALNTSLINQFTSKKPDSRKNIASFDKVMTENDLTNLKNFINDTPEIKNILSITFDKLGKDGTYFKPRDWKRLSGGQLLKDILIEKDHIFPISEVSVLDRPTKTFIGRFGPGAALSESPYNKVLTTNHFNNSIRNNIQNFLNVNPDNQEAIKQINNTLQGIDTTIYHNGRYYGGKITPSILKQIQKMGYTKFDLEESVVNNIKGQESAIKKLKKQNYSDGAIKKALLNSKYAFPFVIGYGAFEYGEDLLKDSGLIQKQFQQTASASDAPLVEKGFSTGEKLAGAGAAAGTAYKFGKPILKTLGKTADVALGPVGLVGLNYALGVNPKETIDRVGLEAEAALAPAIVRGATNITDKIKNPLARKTAELLTTISPKYAMRAARIASPLGIASLGGEALYNYGKFAKNEIAKVKEMTPEERNFYNDLLMDEGGLLD